MRLESVGCQTLCMPCHVLKTGIEREEAGTFATTNPDRSAREKERRQERQAYVDARKKAIGKCEECGTPIDFNRPYHSQAFQFAHRDASAKIPGGSIAQLVREIKPFTTIEKEINKCRLLCGSCHHEETRSRREYLNDLL